MQANRRDLMVGNLSTCIDILPTIVRVVCVSRNELYPDYSQFLHLRGDASSYATINDL